MRARRRTGRAITAAARAVIVGLALVLVGAAASAISGPVVRIGGPEHQQHPDAEGDLLIWTQSSQRRPNVDHAYWKVLGQADRTRIDAPRTRGAAGGIEPGGLRAIYQRMTARTSDLWWYRFEDGHRSKLAIEGVNTDRWERDPRVSDRFLLFARDAGTLTSIHLVDRDARTVERIAAYDFTRFSVAPGAVGDRYATWTTCGPFSCTSWSYDTQELEPVPRKIRSDGRPQYAPAIDEVGGWVYTVRSGPHCGTTVGIWRQAWPIGPATPPAERLVELPEHIDVGFTLALDRSSGTQTDLWFSRHRCGSQQGDVAVLRDVETFP